MLRTLLIVLFALLPGLAGAAPLKVVATLPDLAALAQEVGGERVEVSAMALPTQDPHFVDARPNLALKLARADALVLAGLQLEVGWLPTLLTGSRNAGIQQGTPGYVDASTFVDVLQVPEAPVDRSQGDIHPGGNPHYLLDPRRAVQVAHGLAERFATLDPSHRTTYEGNAEAFEQAIEAKRSEWETALAGLEGQPVVAYHRSFPYLADWLGFEIVEALEPKPGIPPTPKHVAHVLHVMDARGVDLLIQEAYYPDTTSRLVADKAGAELVVIAGGTDVAGGQTYQQRMAAAIEKLGAALEGP